MIAAIILAAGDSRRMGSPKALLPFRGSTFIDYISDNLVQAGCQPVIPVLGKDAEQIIDNSKAAEFQYVVNSFPQKGMLYSIQTAIKTLPDSVNGFLLALVDHPFVLQKTYKDILKTAQAKPERIIIPQFENNHGHPVFIGQHYFQEILRTPVVFSLRSVIEKHKPAVVYLQVNDEGVLKDIDNSEALAKYGLRKNNIEQA